MWSRAFNIRRRSGGEITATVLGSVSRWNGMKHHIRRIGQFKDGNLQRMDPPRNAMRCIYQNYDSLQTPSWQNVQKWQKKSRKDMAWMEMLMGLSKTNLQKPTMCRADDSNFLKVSHTNTANSTHSTFQMANLFWNWRGPERANGSPGSPYPGKPSGHHRAPPPTHPPTDRKAAPP